jgi:hypothetical protein
VHSTLDKDRFNCTFVCGKEVNRGPFVEMLGLRLRVRGLRQQHQRQQPTSECANAAITATTLPRLGMTILSSPFPRACQSDPTNLAPSRSTASRAHPLGLPHYPLLHKERG